MSSLKKISSFGLAIGNIYHELYNIDLFRTFMTIHSSLLTHHKQLHSVKLNDGNYKVISL